MTGGALIGSLVASLVFPGFGQGLSFRRNRMIAWAVAAVLTTFAILLSVWFVLVTFAVRIAAAADAYFVLRHQTTHGNRVLAAIAVVVGAVGLGFSQLALEVFKIPSSSMYPTLVIGDHVYVDKLSVKWRAVERGEIIVFEQPCARAPYIKRVVAVGGDTVEVRCSNVYVNGKPLDTKLVAARDAYKDRDERDGSWFARACSRYRETTGARSYDTFHDIERPLREQNRGSGEGDVHDFPRRDGMMPSCNNNQFYEPRGGASQPTGKVVETKPGAAPCEPQLHYVVPPGALFVMGDNRNNANDSRYWGAVAESAVIGRAIGIWLTDGDKKFGRFGSVR